MPTLSFSSKIKLDTCVQPLITLMEASIENAPFEFRITCGIRSQAEQDELLRIGASRIKSSKHQIGCAVDIVPWINNVPRWDWSLYFKLATHIREVAKQLDINIIWGGSWNQNFTNTVVNPEILQKLYIQKCKDARKKPFLDGPHFELTHGEIKKLGL